MGWDIFLHVNHSVHFLNNWLKVSPRRKITELLITQPIAWRPVLSQPQPQMVWYLLIFPSVRHWTKSLSLIISLWVVVTCDVDHILNCLLSLFSLVNCLFLAFPSYYSFRICFKRPFFILFSPQPSVLQVFSLDIFF